MSSRDAYDESSYHSSEWSDIEDEESSEDEDEESSEDEDEESSEDEDEESSETEDEESSEDDEALSAEDRRLFAAVKSDDADAAEAVQQAIRDGGNVNVVRRNGSTPLLEATHRGNDPVIRILLDAGADARYMNRYEWSALKVASDNGHVSTVQLLINHDNGLLKMTDEGGFTPLSYAVLQPHSDIVRLMLDGGADANCAYQAGATVLMYACRIGNLDNVRLLLAAGVDVEARDEEQQTALHHATAGIVSIAVVRELILQYNANMFAVDRNGRTPFDLASLLVQMADVFDHLLEMYGNKLTEDHGRLALHELLKVADYSFAEDEEFRPPLNPLRIILPLGKLTLKHLRTLLHTLDPELGLIRNRDDTGKLPIHIACQTKLQWKFWP